MKLNLFKNILGIFSKIHSPSTTAMRSRPNPESTPALCIYLGTFEVYISWVKIPINFYGDRDLEVGKKKLELLLFCLSK